MRSLTVRTLYSWGPLFCKGLPVWGCCGGGKSRLGGIQTQLHGGLVSELAEGGEELGDLFLAGVDDLAGGCLVDGVGDAAEDLFEFATEGIDQGVGGQLRLGWHADLRARGAGEAEADMESDLKEMLFTSRKICHTRAGRVGFVHF